MCEVCVASNEARKNSHGYLPGDDEETPHRKQGKSKTKKHFKGCPATNGKAHVYVWIEFRGWHRQWWAPEKPRVQSIWWQRECIGCGHVKNRRYFNGKPPEVYEVRKVDHDWW